MISRRLFNTGLISALGMTVSDCWSLDKVGSGAITGIDCHAHIFSKDLPMVKGHRYSLQYDAPLAQYIQVLDAHNISNGVLIQPSFLGTDNDYLIAALQKYPKRLRGVVVIDPVSAVPQLEQFAKIGVAGIRLNLINQPDPDFTDKTWRNLLPHLKALDLHIELHAEARRMSKLLPPLIDQQIKISIDHFGRPDPATGIDDPGFQYLMKAGSSRLVWIKISGTYRNSSLNAGDAIGLQAFAAVKKSFGLDRMVWGSDWPHVGYEKIANYDQAYAFMQKMLPNAADRRVVMIDTPSRLYKF